MNENNLNNGVNNQVPYNPNYQQNPVPPMPPINNMQNNGNNMVSSVTPVPNVNMVNSYPQPPMAPNQNNVVHPEPVVPQPVVQPVPSPQPIVPPQPMIQPNQGIQLEQVPQQQPAVSNSTTPVTGMINPVPNEPSEQLEDANNDALSQTTPIPNINTLDNVPQMAEAVETVAIEPIPEITPNADTVEAPVDIQPSVVEENSDGAGAEGSGDDVTFDYNALYGIQTKDIQDIKPQEETKKPMFTTQAIVFEDQNLTERKNDDIVPEFNLNALDSTQKTDAKLTDKVLDEKQQNKADTRRKIIYIVVLVLLIFIFFEFIIPKLAGYNL